MLISFVIKSERMSHTMVTLSLADTNSWVLPRTWYYILLLGRCHSERELQPAVSASLAMRPATTWIQLLPGSLFPICIQPH